MIKKLLVSIALVGLVAGCSDTWSTSNVKQNPPQTALAPISAQNVILAPDALPGKSYTPVSELKVSVNKTTAFHPSPTVEAVEAKLREEAAAIGADAVINTKISNVQIGALSWGLRTGTGTAVKLNK